MKTIIQLVFLNLMTFNLYATVNCSPSSCNPGCDSSCTYYTCDQEASHSFDIKKLPAGDEDKEPSNACEYTKFQENKIPFNFQGIKYSKVPTTVTNKYKVCQARTNYGPACPPPVITTTTTTTTTTK